jgi:hypothetical protein
MTEAQRRQSFRSASGATRGGLDGPGCGPVLLQADDRGCNQPDVATESITRSCSKNTEKPA